MDQPEGSCLAGIPPAVEVSLLPTGDGDWRELRGVTVDADRLGTGDYAGPGRTGTVLLLDQGRYAVVTLTTS